MRVFLSFLIQLIRLAEYREADGEQQNQGAHGDVFILQRQAKDVDGLSRCQLADDRNQRHAHERRTLTKNIHQAVEFAAAFGGNDLAQIAAAQGLNAALEHADQCCQHPELPLRHQEHGEQGDAGIGGDADPDQQAGVIFGRQTAENYGTGESHELGQKQCQQQSRGVQSQRSAVSRCHVDDGVNAVDEEEKGDEVQKNVLFLFRIPDVLPS